MLLLLKDKNSHSVDSMLTPHTTFNKLHADNTIDENVVINYRAQLYKDYTLKKCHRRLLFVHLHAFAPELTCILSNVHTILDSYFQTNCEKIRGTFSHIQSRNAVSPIYIQIYINKN